MFYCPGALLDVLPKPSRLSVGNGKTSPLLLNDMKKWLKSRPRIFYIFIRQTFCVVLPLSRMLTNIRYKLNKRLEFSSLSVFKVGALLASSVAVPRKANRRDRCCRMHIDQLRLAPPSYLFNLFRARFVDSFKLLRSRVCFSQRAEINSSSLSSSSSSSSFSTKVQWALFLSPLRECRRGGTSPEGILSI